LAETLEEQAASIGPHQALPILLVGGLEPWNFMTCHINILGLSSSQLTENSMIFRGWLKPPTSYGS
jgi:hypothetical protein